MLDGPLSSQFHSCVSKACDMKLDDKESIHLEEECQWQQQLLDTHGHSISEPVDIDSDN
jgi:hypothetical protein